ncbi:hypothetical protein Fcan01_08552 [Folsomia candida]|uniref:Uncharacterized protein n=1 Tax=Folsomia candida TaxID=158441 RepID=A0A226EL31_FOLCA|nr:hypothetical protein Fcan01_08552 [Folsomia candida]
MGDKPLMEIISPKSYQIVDLLIKNSDLFLAEEYKRVLGDRKKNLLSTYVTAAKSKGINLLGNNMVSLRRKPHENYSVNITLPPMEFFLRGCARSYHTGCIMDVSRPGVYHEDCFCHRDLCNGNLSSSNDSSIFVSSWMALVLHFVMRIVDGIVLKTRSRLNEKMVLNNNDASYGKEIPELKLLL